MRSKTKRPLETPPQEAPLTFRPDAAGLDIGAEEIWACMPPEQTAQPVRCFGTFTPDLHALADWLAEGGVKTVAMESTGVYWIPIYEVLEARGFEVYLVNAHHLKNVPGRKSDVQDCQWIQRLHSYGLWRASFRPAEDLRVLRSYLRQRAMLVEHRAAHIQHMQKALAQMNVQLMQVVSDVTGQTGLQIIRAIVAGERDPQILAQLRHGRCHASEADIAKALTGHYQPEHVFALAQAVALYDFYTTQVAECDRYIAQHYTVIKPTSDPGTPLAPLPSAHSRSKNAPRFDVRSDLYRILGVDLTAVTGIDASTAQTLISEIGTDLSKWPTAKHFTSWLGLAPHNDISGGKILRSRPLPGRNRAGQALRRAAQSVGRTQTSVGAYYRRMRTRKGPRAAITATAHKLARIVYHLLTQREPYDPLKPQEEDDRWQHRELTRLKRKAKHLGFTLQPATS